MLQACKECGKPVSTRAKTCPQCGVSDPTWTFKDQVGLMVTLAILIGLSVFAFAMCSGPSDEGPETTTPSVTPVLDSEPVSTDTLIDEIFDHVLDPCYLYAARFIGLTDQLDDEAAVVYFQRFEAETVEGMITALLPQVEGLPLEDRTDVYESTATACIEAVRSG